MSWWVLDEENFRCCCGLLLQQSEQLRDGWSWEAVQGSEEGYLKKTALRSVVVDSSPVWDHEGSASDSESRTSCHSSPDQLGREEKQVGLVVSVDADSITGGIGDKEDDEEDEDDGVCAVSEGSSQTLQYEYHILHSCSYSAPVLYFRAFTQDGRSLSLEEEHPLLGQPFFMIHPCRTEEFMRPVLQAARDQHRSVNYVLLWLSVVGPVVGLDVPLKYATQLHPAAALSSTEPE
ncbi:hypothetical protein FQN60_016433 [Etheostoma spectabile]|uniref:Ubiquitin-like-conjugating enzyme ATG10 n=1 Tax=Etheostoma spectabile TaxID=54343 RepID=A0A5J5D7N7_9PERO|nr:hypothetical protein FQN60_016433 [Etheostoma spectabile]